MRFLTHICHVVKRPCSDIIICLVTLHDPKGPRVFEDHLSKGENVERGTRRQ
jgi:hypothetical protein